MRNRLTTLCGLVIVSTSLSAQPPQPHLLSDTAKTRCVPAADPVSRDPLDSACLLFMCAGNTGERIRGCLRRPTDAALVSISEGKDAPNRFLIGFGDLELRPVLCLTKADDLVIKCEPQGSPERTDEIDPDSKERTSCQWVTCELKEAALKIKVCPAAKTTRPQASGRDADQRSPDGWHGLQMCFSDRQGKRICLDPAGSKHIFLDGPEGLDWCPVE